MYKNHKLNSTNGTAYICKCYALMSQKQKDKFKKVELFSTVTTETHNECNP